MALSDDGEVYEWSPGKQAARKVEGPWGSNKIIAIETEEYHCFALSDQGKLYGWGYTQHDEFGKGTPFSCKYPVRITNALKRKHVTAIKIGNGYRLVLTKDGEIFQWGFIHDLVRYHFPYRMKGPLKKLVVTGLEIRGEQNIATVVGGDQYWWGRRPSVEILDSYETSLLPQLILALESYSVILGFSSQ